MSRTNPTNTTQLQEVVANVYRLELPLPLDGFEVVNCYVIVGDNELTLVDPGWSTDMGEAALIAGLHSLGYSPVDVTRTLVTHAHPDHITMAAKWQTHHGIPLHLGAAEKPSIVAFTPNSTRFPRQAELLIRAGLPGLSRTIRDLELLDYEREMAWAEASVWLEDQQVIDCDGHAIKAHLMPGHTRGHMVYEDMVSSALFTGDHVLPRVTPGIGIEPDPEESPLTSYLASLQALLNRSDGSVLPAHGPVTPSVHDRARQLLAHHQERFDLIAARVADGCRSAGEVALAMTWTRRQLPLAQLDPVHQMTAVVETLYHLDTLVERGQLTTRRRGYLSEYAPA